jgi:gamma-glutamylaminecyclotransferase
MSDIERTHPHLIFVYGTLKKGHGNNPLLVRHDSRYLGAAATVEREFILNGGFPFVGQATYFNNRFEQLEKMYGNFYGRVKGDLYRVTDVGLAACDRLEGHPDFYERTPIKVQLWQSGSYDEPEPVEAGIYLTTRALALRDLQRPEDGMLEWGRDDREKAEAFQRRGSRQ